MRRALAIVLIAVLTTLMVGIDRTSWAGQGAEEKKREKQRTAVDRALGEMHRGTTATVEHRNGEKFDVVIQEITADTITVLREDRDRVVTATIPIADIARIKTTSAQKMSAGSKVLIGVAVALGVLVLATVAACASISAEPRAENTAAAAR
jgi:flagellar basal body-associated protein FliL